MVGSKVALPSAQQLRSASRKCDGGREPAQAGERRPTTVERSTTSPSSPLAFHSSTEQTPSAASIGSDRTIVHRALQPGAGDDVLRAPSFRRPGSSGRRPAR